MDIEHHGENFQTVVPIGVHEVQRDEEYWYQDGSVVLIAEGWGFRVFHGILAEHSEVFRDLLSIPQLQTMEQIDNCPVVHLSDRAADLRHLLRFLFHARQHFAPDRPVKTLAVAALIRLGHKYQIEDAMKEGATRLQDAFPVTLDAWRERYDPYCLNLPRSEIQRLKKRRKLIDDGNGDRYGCDVTAVHLARLLDSAPILVTALYFCCEYPGHRWVEGVKMADGSVEQLSPEEVARCIDGRMMLMSARATAVGRIYALHGPSYGGRAFHCQDRKRCDGELKRFLDRVLYNDGCEQVELAERSIRALESGAVYFDDEMVNLCGESDFYYHFCSSCKAFLIQKEREEQEELWNRLPEIFDGGYYL
ncbi:uncharacterized protein LAESUDRAFT_754812 [Laetiporus sulphureus 93-53]|uniref:BTB domain-containing protein n=1 Tax=Laetiporus sulphureus 93-53 TaxID=1314785 RepID=A0A165H1M4_9APHY|nr:uncharacterized protein LAESUDRAFT_754812 [Laetiporus sulphureus 93-53]KZT11118.1 hypothetical protein LAESUDRAFT_754812 [Laetiporus sulphureus 93-53]